LSTGELEGRSPWARAIVKLTSPPLVTALLAVYWLLCSAIVVEHYRHIPETVHAPDGSVPTGDFLAFYTGATLVARGDGRSLYDLRAQSRLQAEYLGPDRPELYPYVYPAPFAVILAPLAKLSYRTAALTFNAVNALLGIAAAVLLYPVIPRLRERGGWLVFFAAAGFQPLLRVWATGAQTTVITFFILAGATRALVAGRPLLLGLFVGLLGYKPQFLPPVLLALLAWRMWSALAVTALVGAGHWLLGALACGPRWPLDMLHMLSEYRKLEVSANFATHVSFLAVCERALPGAVGKAIAAVLIVATLALIAWRANAGRASERERLLAWAIAASATLLVSPHAQYYDTGILVVPALVLLESELRDGREPSPWLRAALLAGFFGYPFYDIVGAHGFQPLVFWPIALIAWSVLRRDSSPSSQVRET